MPPNGAGTGAFMGLLNLGSAKRRQAPPRQRSTERPSRSRALALRVHPRLRLPRHRATTAHVCALYPFQAEPPISTRGVYLGTLCGPGGVPIGPFVFDPFSFYTDGALTNTNMLVIGEVGSG